MTNSVKQLTNMSGATRAAALLSVLALMAAPLAANAQNVPSFAERNNAQTIQGRVSSIPGKYTLEVQDSRGFVDNVQLHDGTVINPTGLTLEPGMNVTISGVNDGSYFVANEIDAPNNSGYYGNGYGNNYGGYGGQYNGYGSAYPYLGIGIGGGYPYYGGGGYYGPTYYNTYSYPVYRGPYYRGYPRPYPYRGAGYVGGRPIVGHGGYHGPVGIVRGGGGTVHPIPVSGRPVSAPHPVSGGAHFARR